LLETLIHLLRAPRATEDSLLPDLPAHSRGLPSLSDAPCTGCGACAAVCPTQVVKVEGTEVSLDLGGCLACNGCVEACPTGTVQTDRSTRVAARQRDNLVLRRGPATARPEPAGATIFRRSLHLREVSTGDNAADLEVAASDNPIFDASRFGIHFVASPRHADALLVTGPVGLAMHEPLRRCYEAMAEPRLVMAAGAAAVSGGLHRGGYASANGVDAVLPVDVYIPGNPPHPLYLLHGMLLAMGRVDDARPDRT
jgi:Ni,Fe-hydrogenase III small subunit/ferredoxin